MSKQLEVNMETMGTTININIDSYIVRKWPGKTISVICRPYSTKKNELKENTDAQKITKQVTG